MYILIVQTVQSNMPAKLVLGISYHWPQVIAWSWGLVGQKRLQAVNTHSSREDFQALLLSCHIPDAMGKTISMFFLIFMY